MLEERTRLVNGAYHLISVSSPRWIVEGTRLCEFESQLTEKINQGTDNIRDSYGDLNIRLLTLQMRKLLEGKTRFILA